MKKQLKDYDKLKKLISETVKEAVHIMPGTPEWDKLQDAIKAAGIDTSSSKAPRVPSARETEPEASSDVPAFKSKQPAMALTPEDAGILRRAFDIMQRLKGK